VLAGSSAGGICWFEGGTTDSFGRELRAFTDGLGLLPGSYCPHYNSEPGRRPLYHQLISDGTLADGIACDDGAAAHYTDDTLTELIADRPTSGAYRVSLSEGSGVTEAPLPTRCLDASEAAFLCDESRVSPHKRVMNPGFHYIQPRDSCDF